MKQCVCWASKKAGGSTRNKKRNLKVKPSRGWKKYDGDYVEEGMILLRQIGLKVYPGENVSFNIVTVFIIFIIIGF